MFYLSYTDMHDFKYSLKLQCKNFLMSSKEGKKNPFTQDSNEKLNAHNKSYHNILERRISLSVLLRHTLKLKSGMRLIILDFFRLLL